MFIIIKTDDTLKNNYEIYQKVSYAVYARNKDILKNVIHDKNKDISSYMKKAIKKNIFIMHLIMNIQMGL